MYPPLWSSQRQRMPFFDGKKARLCLSDNAQWSLSSESIHSHVLVRLLVHLSEGPSTLDFVYEGASFPAYSPPIVEAKSTRPIGSLGTAWGCHFVADYTNTAGLTQDRVVRMPDIWDLEHQEKQQIFDVFLQLLHGN